MGRKPALFHRVRLEELLYKGFFIYLEVMKRMPSSEGRSEGGGGGGGGNSPVSVQYLFSLYISVFQARLEVTKLNHSLSKGRWL